MNALLLHEYCTQFCKVSHRFWRVRGSGNSGRDKRFWQLRLSERINKTTVATDRSSVCSFSLSTVLELHWYCTSITRVLHPVLQGVHRFWRIKDSGNSERYATNVSDSWDSQKDQTKTLVSWQTVVLFAHFHSVSMRTVLDLHWYCGSIARVLHPVLQGIAPILESRKLGKLRNTYANVSDSWECWDSQKNTVVLTLVDRP